LTKSNKVRDADKLDRYLAKAKAARDWNQKTIDATATGTLIKAYSTMNADLRNPEFPLPLLTKLTFNSKAALEFVKAGLYDKWAECTQPFSLAEASDLVWNPSMVTFAQIDISELTPKEQTLVYDHWSSSVICDPLLALVRDACEDSVPTHIVTACSTWLSAWQGIEKETSTVSAKLWQESEPLQVVVKVLKGLVALADPTPRLFSAALSDVSFLMPMGGAGADKQCLEKTGCLASGRALSRWLSTREGPGRDGDYHEGT
jgi:hypothetical protein